MKRFTLSILLSLSTTIAVGMNSNLSDLSTTLDVLQKNVSTQPSAPQGSPQAAPTPAEALVAIIRQYLSFDKNGEFVPNNERKNLLESEKDEIRAAIEAAKAAGVTNVKSTTKPKYDLSMNHLEGALKDLIEKDSAASAHQTPPAAPSAEEIAQAEENLLGSFSRYIFLTKSDKLFMKKTTNDVLSFKKDEANNLLGDIEKAEKAGAKKITLTSAKMKKGNTTTRELSLDQLKVLVSSNIK